MPATTVSRKKKNRVHRVPQATMFARSYTAIETAGKDGLTAPEAAILFPELFKDASSASTHLGQLFREPSSPYRNRVVRYEVYGIKGLTYVYFTREFAPPPGVYVFWDNVKNTRYLKRIENADGSAPTPTPEEIAMAAALPAAASEIAVAKPRIASPRLTVQPTGIEIALGALRTRLDMPTARQLRHELDILLELTHGHSG